MAAHRRMTLVALTLLLVALFSSYRLFAATGRPSSCLRRLTAGGEWWKPQL